MQMQVLLYDDEEMLIYNVIEIYTKDNECANNEVPRETITAKITAQTVKAELDPTTMKRIAKYNLDKDFEIINSQTAKALEHLASLNRLIEEKEKKLAFIEELLRKIWEDEDFDEDKYLPDDEED